jgi:hypothetical protein
MPTIDSVRPTTNYSQNYKDEVFFIWWKAGKPNVAKLSSMIFADEGGNIPSKMTLVGWIKNEFTPRSQELDAQFYAQVEAEVMQEKAKMLKEHAQVGKEISSMAIKYLKEHEDELTINSSIRLLVEGVRIERESVGIPAIFDKISEKTDEELLKELQNLISDGNVIDLQPIMEDE